MNDADSHYPVEEHRRFASETRCGAIAIVNILEQWVDFRTVLDLGCGTGTWLRVLRDEGRRQVFGVNSQAVDPSYLEIDPDLFLTADLGRKLDLHRRYDLVVCLEVAEHIDARHADVVVENCVRHADLVLFSAALPGQQGFEHINEQPPQHWAQRFQNLGYVVLDLIRPLIWDDPHIPVWYRQNVLLFARNGSTQLETLRAKVPGTGSGPLAVAHPEYMRWFSTQAQAATAEAEASHQRLIQAQSEFAATLASLAQQLENASSRLQTEQKARIGVEVALITARRRHDEAVRAQITETTALAQARHDVVAAQVARDTAQRAHDLASAELAAVRGELVAARGEVASVGGELAAARGEVASVREEVGVLRWEREIILGSTLWRAIEPLRRLGRALSPALRQRLRRLARALFPRPKRANHPEDHPLQLRPWEARALPEGKPPEHKPPKPESFEPGQLEPGQLEPEHLEPTQVDRIRTAIAPTAGFGNSHVRVAPYRVRLRRTGHSRPHLPRRTLCGRCQGARHRGGLAFGY